MLLLILVVVLSLVISAIIVAIQSRDLKLKADLTRRIIALRDFADTTTFKSPDSTDLVPGITYGNAFIKRDTGVYDVTIFDSTGIQKQRLGITEEELNEISKSYDWRIAAERYSTTEGGKTIQFEQRKK
jgi:hypothetical protein